MPIEDAPSCLAILFAEVNRMEDNSSIYFESLWVDWCLFESFVSRDWLSRKSSWSLASALS